MGLSEKLKAGVDRKVKGSQAGLEQAAYYLRQQLREAVNTHGTPEHPSRPGEPPHRVTGKLYNSIQVTIRKGVATVGTHLNYGGYLDKGTGRMAPRPWFRATIERCRAKMRTMIFPPKKAK